VFQRQLKHQICRWCTDNGLQCIRGSRCELRPLSRWFVRSTA